MKEEIISKIYELISDEAFALKMEAADSEEALTELF